MSGIGKIAFEHLKYNHANNHDNIVTIFFRYSENQKNSRQKSLLRTKVITFLRKCAIVYQSVFCPNQGRVSVSNRPFGNK